MIYFAVSLNFVLGDSQILTVTHDHILPITVQYKYLVFIITQLQ